MGLGASVKSPRVDRAEKSFAWESSNPTCTKDFPWASRYRYVTSNIYVPSIKCPFRRNRENHQYAWQGRPLRLHYNGKRKTTVGQTSTPETSNQQERANSPIATHTVAGSYGKPPVRHSTACRRSQHPNSIGTSWIPLRRSAKKYIASEAVSSLKNS